MSSRTRLFVLLVSAPVIVFAVVGGFLGKAIARDDTYQNLRVFQDVVQLIDTNYVEEIDLRKVMRGAMHGLADGLDPDSAYLSAEQVRQVERGDEHGAADVGLQLTRQYYLRVIAARDNSPAWRAGLRTGDYIRAIDGKPTRDTSVFTGSRLLQGAPGSKVTLTVLRGNAAEPHDVEVVREVAASGDVTGRLQGAGVGYVRIAGFGPRVAEQLKSQMAELSRGGAASLIVDVRGAAEGELDQGIAAARLLVSHGTLAMREARGAEREMISANAGDGAMALPVAVLIDGGTSGPAELFAAALAGNKRAELIGEKTVGRAAVQKLIKLPDGGGLWLSGTRYLTPAGAAIHEKGLEPHIEVEQPDIEFGAAAPPADPTIDKALERLALKKAA